jgi:lysophospholipase L1-like esterase
MKKTLLLIVCLLLTACYKPPRPLARLPGNAVILAFGDSLTYGTGASPEHDYPSILGKLTTLEVINEGVPGEISSDGLKRLPALLDEYHPKLLILIHGSNDIIKKIPSEQISDNLKQMIAEAKNRNIEVLMLGVPQPNLLLLNSADFYRNIADTQQVLIDLDTLPDILDDNSLKSDMIHPNDAGYQLMATNIFKLLQDAGAL